MTDRATSFASCDELAAWARTGDGYPTRLAKAVHGRIGLLRGEHDAVQAYQPPGNGGHIWNMDPMAVPNIGLGSMDTPIAESPAALSDQLLAVLFGKWPMTGAAKAVAPNQRPPSLVAKEVDWDEWLAVVGRNAVQESF